MPGSEEPVLDRARRGSEPEQRAVRPAPLAFLCAVVRTDPNALPRWPVVHVVVHPLALGGIVDAHEQHADRRTVVPSRGPGNVDVTEHVVVPAERVRLAIAQAASARETARAKHAARAAVPAHSARARSTRARSTRTCLARTALARITARAWGCPSGCAGDAAVRPYYAATHSTAAADRCCAAFAGGHRARVPARRQGPAGTTVDGRATGRVGSRLPGTRHRSRAAVARPAGATGRIPAAVAACARFIDGKFVVPDAAARERACTEQAPGGEVPRANHSVKG